MAEFLFDSPFKSYKSLKVGQIWVGKRKIETYMVKNQDFGYMVHLITDFVYKIYKALPPKS